VLIVALIVLALALLPLIIGIANLGRLHAPPPASSQRLVSVLIPARNEAPNIGAAIESVLASDHARFELLVLDDESEDRTADIVADHAVRDSRVRLIPSPGFEPSLWGKPQACAALAERARGEILLFMDADVRLEPDAIARIAAALDESPAAMLSGVPAQVTVGFAEKLIVPLIHFVLLGFLPLSSMRRSTSPDFGVACGQLIAVERDAYEAAGGHRSIADRIHDGMALARELRRRGRMTDIADFTPLARCRLYHSWREVIAGFAKNAHEGLGSPRGIVPWSLLLLGGHCAWIALLPAALVQPVAGALLIAAALAGYALRSALTRRFEQSLLSAALHPLGVLVLVAIQWYALARRLAGRPVAWKARVRETADESVAVTAPRS
jgi:hypothetical protein